MKLSFVSLLLVLAPALVAASPMSSKTIKGAVIVRVDKRNHSLSIATLGKKPANRKEAAAALAKVRFAAVAQENSNLNELDREAGASSWYCNYSPNYYNNSLFWFGFNYQPYYYYQQQQYAYYYYSSQPYYGGYNNNGYNNNYDGYNRGWR